jgi:tetratricopeptide (TPR) repeat protein
VELSGDGSVRPLSARVRIAVVTGVVAAITAAGAVGFAVVRTDRYDPIPPESVAPRAGLPPLAIDLGVRSDPEAADLRLAQRRYEEGDLDAARAIFARHSSLEARVGRAMTTWPGDTVDLLNRLAGLHPQSAVVQVNLGLALLWANQGGAEDAWRAAAEAAPDTSYAVIAGNLLHPEFAPDLPRFVPGASLPPAVGRLAPARQLDALERLAAEGDRLGILYYGVALQRLGRQRSARKVFDAYARAHPDDVEALVAAAVSRFDKAMPAAAFSRLGPLTRRFPASATVRFHLGLLLLWSGEVDAARRQLRLARKAEPGSALAREAARYERQLDEATS